MICEFNDNVAYIDGEPYLVCLPMGKLGGEQKQEERFWDYVLQVAIASNVDLYIKDIDSWCQEKEEDHFQCPDSGEWCVEFSAAVRSTECCTHGGTAFLTWARMPSIGFRPCLIPFDPEAMIITAGPWAGIKDGEVVSFGSLYMGETVVSIPKDTRVDGDTTRWDRQSHIRIADTSRFPNEQINWMKVGDVLVADRNLLVEISWDDLDKMGLAQGHAYQRKLIDEAFTVPTLRNKEKYQNKTSLANKIAEANAHKSHVQSEKRNRHADFVKE